MKPSSLSMLISAVKAAGNKIPRNVRKYVIASFYHKKEAMRGGFSRLPYREYRIMTESGKVILFISRDGVAGDYAL
jgi:hypothetical protein